MKLFSAVITVLLLLNACGEGHPSGVDRTLNDFSEALKARDCTGLKKIMHPTKATEDFTLKCKENISSITDEEIKKMTTIIDYARGAKGKLDESGTIYSINIEVAGFTGDGLGKEITLVKIGNRWYSL